jgi:alanyl-tRNA synthetase
MSGQRAAAEPYTTQFTTTVTAVDDRDVRLETTYFYAESGGQPADTGRIESATVEDVQQVDGETVHRLAEEPSFDVGHSVLCTVDWQRRMYTMRAHTASHALYGVARGLLDELSYGGFDIAAPDGEPGGDEKVRIDFRTTTDIDDETLLELERGVNEVVWNAHDVSWEQVPTQDAFDREDVAYNAATEEGLVGESETVRLVTIEDVDVAACGGTHVRNTREIGPVTVLDHSNPGEGLTRVEFAVGPAGIDHRIAEKRAALAGSAALETNVSDLPDGIARLREERDELRSAVDDLTTALLDARIDRLAATPLRRGEQTWVVGTVEHAGPNAVADHLRGRKGEEGVDVFALVGAGESPFLVVRAGEQVDAASVVDDVTSEFGGGGGGSPTVAQGGGIGVSGERVVEYLRE